ncbi:MAG: hypothetical protein Q8R85_00510 [Bosea sp. (in: a-proteobacteria)]|jgi:hypothetical protein|uniref:Uncharacterized protein n=1 Tax=Bosea massiliensis TaxID=151419 RepID=A0ABW0P635_9HYPH|nr:MULTISPECIES: hypothetical protein [Hyphomicrobiales]MBA4271120.1 hypothetical protein [Methylobacterium sp.]AOG03637.1 hypothetical protein BSY19_1837 [Bosea sp. RAC05]MDP3257587.1 hypothetical protein [Bosea sp. (in: a-proteobacteria)]MDP3318423.1 hypothetical protein [Bosea sp. (in: a-proteobacteria)]MDP3410242.1 hypothetical protein [Bosea sp. (in: a-proteobacteria)]
MNLLDQIVTAFVGRADVGHLGLLLWAATASAAAWFVMRELSAANRRFDDFVRELNRFNARHEGDQP